MNSNLCVYPVITQTLLVSISYWNVKQQNITGLEDSQPRVDVYEKGDCKLPGSVYVINFPIFLTHPALLVMDPNY